MLYYLRHMLAVNVESVLSQWSSASFFLFLSFVMSVSVGVRREGGSWVRWGQLSFYIN